MKLLLILGVLALVTAGLLHVILNLHAAWLARSKMRVLVMADLYLNMASLAYMQTRATSTP